MENIGSRDPTGNLTEEEAHVALLNRLSYKSMYLYTTSALPGVGKTRFHTPVQVLLNAWI